MIENMLLYIRATRQQLWNLHLAAKDGFTKYYFALDLLSYARMSPVYLSAMYNLQTEDPESWKFLKTNFCVNKSRKCFVAIGVDHALEQVNKELKAQGGITGLQDEGIDKYCYTIGVKHSLLAKFSEEFGLSSSASVSSEFHHEETGSFNEFYVKSIKAYGEGLREFIREDWDEIDTVFNVMTTSVLENDEELLNIESIGTQLYENFIKDRETNSEVSVWDTINKRKLITFRENAKSLSITLKNKVIHLKEEKNLMTKLLVISRSRPEIDVAALFKVHKFSVVPRSLFDQTGAPWECTDKSDCLHGLEDLFKNDEQNLAAITASNYGCLVIYGMGLVNRLKITSKTATVRDLALSFCSRVRGMLKDAHTVAVIFDSYSDSPENVKANTWSKRHKKQIRYQLTDRTVLKNIKMKDLLSHPQNKKAITLIFWEIFCSEFSSLQYVVAYGFTVVSNIPGWEISTHNHFEADTLILCCIKEILELQTATSFKVVSPDTDVLVLSVHFLASYNIQTPILFELTTSSGNRVMSVNVIVGQLWIEKANALLGFHVLTGCDHIGSFRGVTKDRSFKTFLQLSSNQLNL